MHNLHFVPTPWKVAKSRGMVHYISPKPCRRGHYSYRPVNRSDCWECKEETRWDKGHRIKRMLLAKAIGASKMGLEFDLNENNVDFPEYCPALGIRLDYSGSDREANATFDRIDPEDGYVARNVRVISGRANRIKSDASHGEIRSILNYIEHESQLHHRPA